MQPLSASRADSSAGIPTTIHQGPCLEQFIAYPIPMSEAEALTPPGFPPLPFNGGGLTPAIRSAATVVTVGYQCAATMGDGVNLGEVRTVGRALVVDPPPRYKDPAVANYVIIFGGWTSSRDMAALYTSWHLPAVEVGEVLFSIDAATPAARVARVSAFGPSGSLDVASAVAGAEEPQQPDTFRLFVFDGESVAGYVDWSWPAGATTIESGAATVKLTSAHGTAAAEVHAGVSFHYYGAYSYDLKYVALG